MAACVQMLEAVRSSAGLEGHHLTVSTTEINREEEKEPSTGELVHVGAYPSLPVPWEMRKSRPSRTMEAFQYEETLMAAMRSGEFR